MGARENAYPRVLLGRNENSFFKLEILRSKQVKICFLLWLFLGFTFLDPLDFCNKTNILRTCTDTTNN